MNACVYDKTEKGREEIATRKYHMPAKMRALLLMIDGRHTLDAVLKNFEAQGMTEETIHQLVSEQYITLIKGEPEPEPETPAAPRRPLSAKDRMAARRANAAHRAADGSGTPSQLLDELLAEGEDDDAPDPTQSVSMPLPGTPAAASAAPAVDEAERFRTLYAFYNETIKSTLGLRGVMLQLKVEKCGNLDDFRAMRTPYLEAILKAKGREMTLSLRDRLDSLLGGKPANDDFVI